MNPEYFTIREFAEYFHLGISTVHKKLKARSIAHIKIDSIIRIPKAEVEAIEEKNYVPRKRVRAF